MQAVHKRETPPNFGRHILWYAAINGLMSYAILRFVVQHNPDHLLGYKEALAIGAFVLFISFSAGRGTGRILAFFWTQLFVFALVGIVFLIYLQMTLVPLKTPASEFLIAALLTAVLSASGAALGAFRVKRHTRASGSGETTLPAATRHRPTVHWISYDIDVGDVDHGPVDLTEATKILDRCLSQSKPHYEVADDAIRETCVRFDQEPETFLEFSVNPGPEFSVDLQIARRDIPGLLRYFNAYFKRKFVLNSRNDAIALLEAFYEITPEDFLPRLSKWSAS